MASLVKVTKASTKKVVHYGTDSCTYPGCNNPTYTPTRCIQHQNKNRR